MTSKIIAVVAAAVGIGLTAAAYGVTPTSSPVTAADRIGTGVTQAHTRHPIRPSRKPRHRAAVALPNGRTFGSGCGILPRSGPASQAGLTAATAAAAVSRPRELSEFAHAIQLAGLTRTLNAAKALTVFAPDNAAFDYLGAGNLQALLATRPDLVRVLRFHVVAGRVLPAQLAKRHVLTTVGGTKLYLARSGRSFSVNNAVVTCGNVRTSNATVYVVNRIIIPAS